MAKTVPVSTRALIQRINRKLSNDDLVLMVAREGSRTAEAYGRYYTVDTRRNQASRGNIDLEKYARELGALAAWERLDD